MVGDATFVDPGYYFLNSILHKKLSFRLCSSSENVSKSAGNWSNLLNKSLMDNFILCAVVHCSNARLLFMKHGLKLPNTDNLLALFITFEWGRIFENAMDRK